MATSVWKGHISFGLVSFPVKLHAAARSQAVSFNQLHQCDHSRVKQVLYCQAEDKPVSRSELVKGFEYEKDRYVVVEERELDQMVPRSSRVMEVLEFVPEAEVDPVYLDASYYVVPERAGEKPYTLLYEALRRCGYVSIAQLTMHSREHLLRPGRFGLLLHTLFYSDEVRTLDEFRTDTEWVAPQELELAHLLVESLAARFEPAKYKDRYRENLRALIDAKIRGEELKLGAMEPAPAPVADIL
jgi:DNA end-binding protein Ku